MDTQQKMEYKIDNDKKGIMMNLRLVELGDSFVNHIEEVCETLPNTKYLCTIEKYPNSDYVSLTWGYCNDLYKDKTIGINDLKEVKYENNLDSMVGYSEPVKTLVSFIFPCLECIRMSLMVDEVRVVILETDQSKSHIFM